MHTCTWGEAASNWSYSHTWRALLAMASACESLTRSPCNRNSWLKLCIAVFGQWERRRLCPKQVHTSLNSKACQQVNGLRVSECHLTGSLLGTETFCACAEGNYLALCRCLRCPHDHKAWSTLTMFIILGLPPYKCLCAGVTCQDSMLMALWLACLGEATKSTQHCTSHCCAHRVLLRTKKL